MCEHEFKVDYIKEKSYTKEQLEYRRLLEKAAEPTKLWLEELAKECCKHGK